MRNLTPASITQAFADYCANAPSARTRDLLVSLAGHLHSFVRENKLTQEEWLAGIDVLTRAAKFTDDKRNEFILISDLLGVSSLVDMVNAEGSGTTSSLLGPFLIEDAQLRNLGDDPRRFRFRRDTRRPVDGSFTWCCRFQTSRPILGDNFTRPRPGLGPPEPGT